MNRDPDERAQSEGGQAPDEFDAIVAHWQREGGVPVWPTDPFRDAGALFEPLAGEPPVTGPPATDRPAQPGLTRPSADEPTPTDSTPTGPVPRQSGPGGPRPDEPDATRPGGQQVPPADPEDDHFVPPEPPPLPRIGPPAIVGLVLLTLGLVLVTAPGWVGVPLVYGLPLGLLAMAAGLGWLVLRLWPDPPADDHGDGEDDGAIL